MEYRQKVPKALTTSLTMGGGSKKPVIFNGVLAVVSIFATTSLWYVPFFMVTHGLIIAATKKDPQWFEVLLKYLKNKRHYRS